MDGDRNVSCPHSSDLGRDLGNTGVLLGLLLVSFVILVALITVLSGIGVAEHGGIGSGGVYSMISSVLGGQMGGTVGLLYVFGQCVAGAMYITGFAESISDLLGLGNIWAVRGISVVVLLALLGINLAGVKWIIRLQLLLLFLLAVSTLDFVVGSFTHLDPGSPQRGAGLPVLAAALRYSVCTSSAGKGSHNAFTEGQPWVESGYKFSQTFLGRRKEDGLQLWL
ncbi:solute carrier family 12 member 8 [Cricetulus griseus]|uniref:solute carrier family 12 member 8 n=1 Tax=Cricetulus griseus TaxID=10029 RepID=UPI0015C2CAFA|nr:solute carrier family 12 member 8 [Cricetulus griseus]